MTTHLPVSRFRTFVRLTGYSLRRVQSAGCATLAPSITGSQDATVTADLM